MTKRIAFLALLAVWLALPSPAQVGRSFLFPETFAVADAGTCTAPVRVTLSDGGYPLYHSLEVLVAPSLPATFTFALEGSTSNGIPAASGGGAFYSLSGTIDGAVAANRLVHPIHRLVQWVRFCPLTLTAAELLTENAFASHTNWDVTGGFTDSTGAAVYLHAPPEVLDEVAFTTHAEWDVAGDFDDSGGNCAYTHSTGAGTCTQIEADQAAAPTVGSVDYIFNYTVGSFTGDVACQITTGFALGAEDLTMVDGAQTLTFTAAANPGDFVISCTSASGTVTFDDVSLKAVNYAGTLTQEDGDFDVAAIGSAAYTLAYTISSPTAGATCALTTAFASVSTALPVTLGAQSVSFTSAASPTDFIISCTSTAGGFTLDDITLSTVPSVQAIYTGQR